MPTTYLFKDSRTADNVAKALLFVAKFSKKQAYVKLSDTSVDIIWGGSPKTYYIHARYDSLDMFRNKLELRNMSCGLEPCTVIQVDPTVLGKTLKGSSQGTERIVSLQIIRPNKIKILVEYVDTAKRLITHTIPCDIKTLDDFKSMLIEEIEMRLCRYNTSSYVEAIHKFKHIIDTVIRLGTPRVYIYSKQLEDGNEIIINARTNTCNIRVNLNELENEFVTGRAEDEYESEKRTEAGVNIDTKRLASFLAGLLANRRSKVLFDIEHNKCLKLTLHNEISQGETFFQSMLLLHSLNT